MTAERCTFSTCAREHQPPVDHEAWERELEEAHARIAAMTEAEFAEHCASLGIPYQAQT